MSLAEAYELLKKIQNKMATKEEQALKQQAFNVIAQNANKALKGII